jgi:hypothetical protein
MLFAKAGRGIPKPLSVHLYVEPSQWVDTTPYFGGEKESCKLGVLGTLLHRSGLSISNGILLYKQMKRPMKYTFPAWRSAIHSLFRKLQMLQSKCLHIATSAPWYICNKQNHGDRGVPFLYRPHLIWGIQLKVWGNPNLRILAESTLTEGWPRSPKAGR